MGGTFLRLTSTYARSKKLAIHFQELSGIEQSHITCMRNLRVDKTLRHRDAGCRDVTSEAEPGQQNDVIAEVRAREFDWHVSPVVVSFASGQILTRSLRAVT
jgi:hypothetical protein